MKVTVSSKYQVVIPKNVRKEAGIYPGQKIDVKTDTKGNVVLKKDTGTDAIDQLLEKYAGILADARTEWKKQGLDPAIWVRKMRDEEWD